MGLMYLRGKKDIQDYQEARKCFVQAAYQGSMSAQFNIGKMHYEGRGVPLDYQRAMEWYLKAADQGDVKSQVRYGHVVRARQERSPGSPESLGVVFESCGYRT